MSRHHTQTLREVKPEWQGRAEKRFLTNPTHAAPCLHNDGTTVIVER